MPRLRTPTPIRDRALDTPTISTVPVSGKTLLPFDTSVVPTVPPTLPVDIGVGAGVGIEPIIGRQSDGYLLIRDLPPTDRPRERLSRYGAAVLTDAELLAIIWRTGTSGKERESALSVASRALKRFGGLAKLSQASATELEAIRGIGPVKAIEVQAAIELGRRCVLTQPENRSYIRSPRDVFLLFSSEMQRLHQEELWVLLMNTKNQVVGKKQIYRGTLNSSTVRIAELFRDAIRENCASVIVVHNHPSGDPAPSPEDVRMTAEAFRAGSLLDIEVLDHVIVGSGTDRFCSLKERGLGFEPG